MNIGAIAVLLASASLLSCTTLRQPAESPHSRVSAVEHMSQDSGALRSPVTVDAAQAKLTPAEAELYELIMEYRKAKGLPPIPVSKSLTYVAKVHVRDLETHAFGASSSVHSWSKDGPWESVSYAPDSRCAQLMWSKPRELTSYRGNGYEIGYMDSSGAKSRDVFNLWKLSRSHDAVIVNEADWSRLQWKSIGIGVFGRYAAVWFGQEVDPEKSG
jgi:uncharacterized protein YkwD